MQFDSLMVWEFRGPTVSMLGGFVVLVTPERICFLSLYGKFCIFITTFKFGH